MAGKVRTFTRGDSARLVRNETEAVQARWDGYVELNDEQVAELAKQTAKDAKAQKAADAPK